MADGVVFTSVATGAAFEGSELAGAGDGSAFGASATFAVSGVVRFSNGVTSATGGGFVELEPGRAICDEMMAGSTGAPGTVG